MGALGVLFDFYTYCRYFAPMQRETQPHSLGFEGYPRESIEAMFQGIALVDATLPNGLYNFRYFDRERFGAFFSDLKSLSRQSYFSELIAGTHIDSLLKGKGMKDYELRALGSHLADILWDRQSVPACRLALQRLLTVFPTALDPRRDAERSIPRSRIPISAELKVSSDFLCRDSEDYYHEFFDDGRCAWVNNYFVVKDYEYTTLLPVVTFRAPNGQVFLKGMLFVPSKNDKVKIEEVFRSHGGMPNGKRITLRNLSLRPARSFNPEYIPTQTKKRAGAFKDLIRDAGLAGSKNT